MTAGGRAGFAGQFPDGATFSVDYHDPTGTFRTEFDFVSRDASEAVVSAVARAKGCDPVDLPPLYRTIDPDALDSIFVPAKSRRPQEDASVEFEFADHAVTVNSHGTVEVNSREGT